MGGSYFQRISGVGLVLGACIIAGPTGQAIQLVGSVLCTTGGSVCGGPTIEGAAVHDYGDCAGLWGPFA